MTRSRSIARLKVTLEEVEPKVVRRLEVPVKIRLDRLHLVRVCQDFRVRAVG